MKSKVKGSLYKRGNVWWLNYTTGERTSEGGYVKKSVSLDTADKVEAQRRAEKQMLPLTLQDEADRSRAVAESVKSSHDRALESATEAEKIRSRIPLATVADQYITTFSARGATRRPLKARTVEQATGYWMAFSKWMNAARPACKHLEEITEADARKYIQSLLDAKMHPRTVTYHRNALNVIWRNAARPSPWAAIPRYTGTVESRRHLEDDELRTICSAATGELRQLLAIGLYTGLRLGDAVSLRWQDIRAGWLHRRTAKRGVEVVFPVHAELAAVLADVAVNKRQSFICPDLHAQYERDSGALCKVLRKHFEASKITGKTERYDGSEDEEEEETPKDAQAAAEADKGKGKKKATKKEHKARKIARTGFHSLRHTFATICAKAGIPQGSVAAWLGHTPAVDEIYQHFGSKDTARIVGALPSGVFANTLALPANALTPDELRKDISKRLKKATPAQLQKIAEVLAAMA